LGQEGLALPARPVLPRASSWPGAGRPAGAMATDVKSDDGVWVTDEGLWDRLQQLRSQLQSDIEQANKGLLEDLKQNMSSDHSTNSQMRRNGIAPVNCDATLGLKRQWGTPAGGAQSDRMSVVMEIPKNPRGLSQRRSLTAQITNSMNHMKSSRSSFRGTGDLATTTEIQVLPSHSQVVPVLPMNDASTDHRWNDSRISCADTSDSKVSFVDEDDILTISARNPVDEQLPSPRLASPQLDSLREGWAEDGTQRSVSTATGSMTTGQSRKKNWGASKTASFLGRLGAVPPDIEAEMQSQQRQAQKPPWLAVMIKVVRSPSFDAFFGMLIVLNSITIGFQTDHMAREVTEVVPTAYMVMDKLFCILFTLELVFRVIALRGEFFNASGYLWGVFDICVIGLQLVEEIILLAAPPSQDSSAGGTNMSFMRVLRILRLIRVLRIIRIIRFMDELRTLVISIMNSMRSLFWTLALLLLGIYVVGIYFTQLSLELQLQSVTDSLVVTYFGALSRSMLTLYGAMSGGIDWDTLVQPLIDDISPVQGVVFALYIAFTVLALTNVVTGVFVEGALKSAKQEEERNMYETLQQMFFLADDKDEGMLTTEQFKSRLESSDMNRYLQSIDINPSEAHLLFELIDSDGSGNVDYAEFVGGCMRIRGAAKAIDVILLLHEVLAVRKTLDSFIEASRISLAAVASAGKTHTVSSTLKTAATKAFT